MLTIVLVTFFFFQFNPFQLPTWGVSLIDSRVAVGHKSEVIVQLFDGKKLYLYPHSRSDCDRWVDLLQRASRRKIGNYYGVTGLVGMGSFAEVRVGYDKSTGQQVAIKVMKKNKRDSELMRSIDCEMNFISKNIDHENIVATYDVFDTRDNLFIVMEYMPGGMLYDILANEGFFTEKNAASVMKDLLYAVDCLHQHDIVHRDIKPENVLALHKTWPLKVKLADFGLADFVLENSFGEKSTCGMYGTPFFVAPEVIKAETYTPAVDIWSLGVLAYNMLSGQLPFDGNNIKEVLRRVRSGRYSFPDSEWADISSDAKLFISGLLEVDPKRRLTAQQALDHPWLTSANISERIITNDRSALGYEQRKLRMSSMAIDDVAGLLRLDDEDEAAAANANSGMGDHGIRALSRLFPGNHNSANGHAHKTGKSGRSSGNNRQSNRQSQSQQVQQQQQVEAKIQGNSFLPPLPPASPQQAQSQQAQQFKQPQQQSSHHRQNNSIDLDDARFIHQQDDEFDEQLSQDMAHSSSLPIPHSSSALSPSSPPKSLSSSQATPIANSTMALTPTQQRKRPPSMQQRQRSLTHRDAHSDNASDRMDLSTQQESLNGNSVLTNAISDAKKPELVADQQPVNSSGIHAYDDVTSSLNDNSAAVSNAVPLRLSHNAHQSSLSKGARGSVESANKVSVHEEDVLTSDLTPGWAAMHIGATTNGMAETNASGSTEGGTDEAGRQRHTERDEQFRGGGLEFNVVGNGDGFALPAILSVKDIMRRRHEAEQLQQDWGGGGNGVSGLDAHHFGSNSSTTPKAAASPATTVNDASATSVRRRRQILQRHNGHRSKNGHVRSGRSNEHDSSDSEVE